MPIGQKARSATESLGAVANGKKEICPCQKSDPSTPTCNHQVTNLAIMAVQIVANMIQRYTKNLFNPTALSGYGIKSYEVI